MVTRLAPLQAIFFSKGQDFFSPTHPLTCTCSVNEVEFEDDERRSSCRGQEFGKRLQRGFEGEKGTRREGCLAPDRPRGGLWIDWSEWVGEIYDYEGGARAGGSDLGVDFNFREEFLEGGFSK